MQIIPILTQASELLLAEYQNYKSGQKFSVHEKYDDSPVTQADLKVNRFLIEALAQLHPVYPVLSEEESNLKRHEWQNFWMLDPLDGTKEFLHKRDEFTINLSLIEQHKTVFSVLVVPVEQVIYLGYTRELPYKYCLKNSSWLGYTSAPKSSQALNVALSHSSRNKAYHRYIEYLEKHYLVERREAGSAYKFCLMLEGKIDIYPRFHPTSEWDTSAGQGLLESIGGGLIALDGQAFQYNNRNTLLNKGFLAFTNPKSKAIALDAIRQLQISD